ncbi:hypothetical protein N7457_008916 [Penicillium paradoxum]|uniref:uncharacterized protein n=1 Tax=Penicillium paradoxum TaxID=176176 RepID=UPI00254723D9|nr:uncharacterized protein N7457_008916 [Penicillium paradoxum]KAJ5774020.1 hypothetical protein N7457_008916 [Penicillium paradoxum]
MQFYQSILAILALGATMVMADLRGGVCEASTQTCKLTSPGKPGNAPNIVVLTCPEYEPCTSDGSGCTGSSYNTVANQCT